MIFSNPQLLWMPLPLTLPRGAMNASQDSRYGGPNSQWFSLANLPTTGSDTRPWTGELVARSVIMLFGAGPAALRGAAPENNRSF